MKISVSVPDKTAAAAAEAYHGAKGDEYGLSELVQAGLVALTQAAKADVQKIAEGLKATTAEPTVELPGLKKKAAPAAA